MRFIEFQVRSQVNAGNPVIDTETGVFELADDRAIRETTALRSLFHVRTLRENISCRLGGAPARPKTIQLLERSLLQYPEALHPLPASHGLIIQSKPNHHHSQPLQLEVD